MAAILRSGRVRVGREPDPGPAADPPGGQPELGAERDQRLLDPAYVVDDADRLGQPDDRVADELARAVPGDLAAAVDLDHRGAVGRAFVRFGALARGVDEACSSMSTVSGRTPAETSAWIWRCCSQAWA